MEEPAKLLDMPTYQLPEDEERLHAEWWTAQEAAKAWGCSYSVARHIYNRRKYEVRRHSVMLVSPRGVKVLQMVPTGTKKPPARLCGNPNMGKSDFARRAAEARWQK